MEKDYNNCLILLIQETVYISADEALYGEGFEPPCVIENSWPFIVSLDVPLVLVGKLFSCIAL